LGLATVYGIVQQHEGWIDVKSQLGRGTTFSVFLPTARSAPRENASSSKAQEVSRKPSGGSDLILLAEDEPHVREFVRLVLTGQGYQVLSAASGPEALKQWHHRPEKIRLLLTDMVMPDGMSGSVLARQLLQCEPNLKVIYMSGYSPEVMANEGALNEGLNFLSKPFSRDALLTAVRRALTSCTPAVELISAQSHSN
jgi:CheY-like chemotaxis protein